MRECKYDKTRYSANAYFLGTITRYNTETDIEAINRFYKSNKRSKINGDCIIVDHLEVEIKNDKVYAKTVSMEYLYDRENDKWIMINEVWPSMLSNQLL